MTLDIDSDRFTQWAQTPIKGTLTPIEILCLWYPLMFLDGMRIAWQKGTPPPRSLRLVRVDTYVKVAGSLAALFLLIRARKREAGAGVAGVPPLPLLAAPPARFARAA